MIKLILIFIISVIQFENQTVVERLQQKFENINFLQADFSQITGNQNILNGRFYFNKENNYRIELSNNTIISDGSSIWNVDKKRNKVIVSNLDEDPLAFSLSDYIYNYPEKCQVEEEVLDDGFLLTFLGKDSDLNFETAKLNVNKDYLIEKITVTDFGGNTFIINFSNIKINDVVANSFFNYKDDGSKKIIDLR